ncbi:aminoglycoside phosphotransferase family protein [Flaviflexus salsibiostraticola]|uniref:Aminoglycoside phosphotransferase family protein n=1 Tax=Flaviflexus salsibiostraticola TaxID=1282737 RepID=A0A3Q8WV85_9ACTO|nr:aminoglycoside phosphotransferase family protein [Flaviflexus salsibiostraticola]AZN30896.1 aminoglycoside phosphotransferase family protein [Flaviflexus salsibiostraticola]
MERLPGLTQRQAELVREWFPRAELIADLSWGLTESTVLQMSTGAQNVVIKAGGHHNSHIAREIRAYETVVHSLAERGAAPTMLRADREQRLLALTHIPGVLVDGGPLESDPVTLRAAGELLGELHGMGSSVDQAIEANLVRAALRWFDRPHRIPAAAAARARRALEDYEPRPAVVVPSHGDYSGRNWIAADQLVVIDFGRFGHRPARQDLLRMHFRRWHDHPEERVAFFSGYGDIADADGHRWWLDVLREAVATAGWAHKVGDEAFEVLGLRFIDVALDEIG